MLSPHLLGVSFALFAAVLFGAGDFSGGFATRRNNPFQVLFLASAASVLMLGGLTLILGEPIPTPESLFWGGMAGVAGALGLAAMYRAISLGNVAIVAPTAGVIGAALPVVFGVFTEGLPELTRVFGFIAAVFGIWFVTRADSISQKVYRQGLLLAVLAGIAFGAFFILIAQVEVNALFVPLLIAKTASLFTALLLLVLGGISLPRMRGNHIALLSGVMDAGANMCYLLARQYTRMDLAAVLASLFPAAAVLLSCLILKEKISWTQWMGVAFCLTAIALIVV